jgi:hypothetical protein
VGLLVEVKVGVVVVEVVVNGVPSSFWEWKEQSGK